MNLRMVLYELAARYGLDATATRQLQQLAGLPFEPPRLAAWLPRGMAVLAAALLGLGGVMAVAANWNALGRLAQFGLLMVWVGISALGAILWLRARGAFALLSLLGIGALFAYFGQTYQTGADPWQLFALWAALALPLCAGARSDVVWVPWTLIAIVAVSLWTHAHAGHQWLLPPQALVTHLWAWLATLLVVLLVSPLAARFTGAGVWALRSAVVLAVVLTTLSCVSGLFASRIAPHFVVGLGLLLAGAVALSRRRWFDAVALSAVAFGVVSLLTAGLARVLFSGPRGSDEIGSLFVIGVAAAGLLSAAVSSILRLNRRFGDEHEGARRAWMNS